MVSSSPLHKKHKKKEEGKHTNKELSSKLDKVIDINIRLQERVTELSMGVIGLAKTVKGLTEVLVDKEHSGKSTRPRLPPLRPGIKPIHPVGKKEAEQYNMPNLPRVPELQTPTISEEVDEDIVFPESESMEERARRSAERTKEISEDLKNLLTENQELIGTLRDLKNSLKKKSTKKEIHKIFERHSR